MKDECVFCEIVAKRKVEDWVFESENFIVIRDVNPDMEGHSLIISKKHFDNFMELDEGLDAEMMKLVRDFVRKEGWKDFNFITNNGKNAGQVVNHFHLHILPRREGDNFKFRL